MQPAPRGGPLRRSGGWRGGRAALMALAVCLLGLAGCAERPVADGAARELRSALVFEPGGERPVRLPDAWEASAPTRDGALRYRFALPDAALQSDQSALYVPRVGNLYRVALNGQPLVSAGVRPPPGSGLPLPDLSHTPVLLPLPAALLRGSGNTLEIEVIGEPRREAGLSTVWVGPMEALEPLHTARINRELRGSWVLGAAATAMGALALLLALRARRGVYAYFAAASLLWAWRLSGLHEDDGSAWTPLATVLHDASHAWVTVLTTLYALAVLGRATARPRAWLALWSAVALLLAGAAWVFNTPLLRSLLQAGSLGVLAWLAAVLVASFWRERSLSAGLLSAMALAAALIGARDFWVLRVLHDYGATHWDRYTSVLLLTVLAWLLVDEFTRSSAGLHRLNRELQDRVAQKERELQAAFEGERAREREQAVLAERDRILREMHDGLGGRLVAALALTSQVARQSAAPPGGAPRSVDQPLKDLKLTLDDCLVELRLALDSLETDQRPLIEALAELRFRIEPSLRAAGMRLVWQVGEAASAVELPAERTLHVLRIVREALTNVIKHAQADTVWLKLDRRDDGGLTLEVLDNGLTPNGAQRITAAAVPPPGLHGGRGLANMQRRAHALGAALESAPQGEGWRVRLALP